MFPVSWDSPSKLSQIGAKGRVFISRVWSVTERGLPLGTECNCGWGRSLLLEKLLETVSAMSPHLRLGEWGSWSDLGGTPQHLLHLSKECSLTQMSCWRLCFLLEVLWSFYIYVYTPPQIYFCVWSELGVEVCVFIYRHLVVPLPFVEKTLPIGFLGSFVENQLTRYVWIYF